MENPFLSIILCTYNGALYLREQLASLLCQSYSNFEIIAIDDCSTDSTFDILKEYAQNGKLKAYRNDKNKGVNFNFQSAIEKATGDYILICDQDDIWELNKLEVMVNSINGSLLYYHDSAFIDAEGRSLSRKLSEKYKMFSNPHPLSFVPQNSVTGHTCMFDRKLQNFSIFPFPENIYYDNWLGYIAAIHGQVCFIDKCLVKYRIHGKNMTASKKKNRKLNDEIMASLYNQMNSFYEFAPESSKYKIFLQKIRDTYKARTLKSDVYRAFLFLLEFRKLTAFRKKNTLRKLSYCIKMSYKPLPNLFLHSPQSD
jgi:Glycosyltransferases involved in cell wall biogenesis